MKRLAAAALALIALIAACAPAATPAVPLASPSSNTAAAETSAPTASPTVAPSPSPAPPVAVKPQPRLEPPAVALERGSFPISSPEGFVPASADDVRSMGNVFSGVEENWSRLFTSYANSLRLDEVKRADATTQFDMQVAPGPFADLLKGWLAMRYADETKTVTVSHFGIDRWYSKPWGHIALADARFGMLVHTDTAMAAVPDRTYDLRVRLTVATSWKIIDVFDATAASWIGGDTARYSPLLLENEVTGAVAGYLQSESYLYGVPEPIVPRPPTTPFWKERVDALARLSALYNSGAIRDRHFEGVTARITRFEPATFLGDGVVTVVVRGTLVEVDANGTRRVVPFTQTLKFLRSFGGESTVWTAADAQEPDGSWDSGGALSLLDLERTFG